MMEVIKAVLLAVVQGLTEFLPVSSSGHLAILEQLLRVKEPGLILAVSLHMGTLLAVAAVYWRDIWMLAKDSLAALCGRKTHGNGSVRFTLAVVIATIPTGLIGLFLNRKVEEMFGSLPIVGAALIVTAAILYLTRFAKTEVSQPGEIGFLQAILIGIAQGIAVLPGISRSGSTISCGLLLGIERETAARFSFILSIPAIIGAAILETHHSLEKPVNWAPILIGTAVAFLVGYFALKFLLQVVKRGRMHLFSWYCLPAGIMTILIWASVGR